MNGFGHATFEEWAATVDYYLSGYTGRRLADLPVLPLRVWWGSGRFSAWAVAMVLAAHLMAG